MELSASNSARRLSCCASMARSCTCLLLGAVNCDPRSTRHRTIRSARRVSTKSAARRRRSRQRTPVADGRVRWEAARAHPPRSPPSWRAISRSAQSRARRGADANLDRAGARAGLTLDARLPLRSTIKEYGKRRRFAASNASSIAKSHGLCRLFAGPMKFRWVSIWGVRGKKRELLPWQRKQLASYLQAGCIARDASQLAAIAGRLGGEWGC